MKWRDQDVETRQKTFKGMWRQGWHAANKSSPVKSYFAVTRLQWQRLHWIAGADEDNNQSIKPWPCSIEINKSQADRQAWGNGPAECWAPHSVLITWMSKCAFLAWFSINISRSRKNQFTSAYKQLSFYTGFCVCVLTEEFVFRGLV